MPGIILPQPRQYSISSSPLTMKNALTITVATVRYRTFYNRIKEGLCSNWLNALDVGDCVPLCILPGTMRLPQDISKPLVFIGPGTGVAPFRSMIEHRHHLRTNAQLVSFVGIFC